MRNLLLILALGVAVASNGQSLELTGSRSGSISGGGRTSFSLFNSGHGGEALTGIGGQFRIRLAERVNTDWFYDYFSGSVGGLAHRQDQHIGWSVLFYLREPGEARQFVQPYILAGHCFDYTKQQANNDPGNFAERWSSAVQAGLGTHFNLTDRMDVSLVSQYMIHLGNEVHADVHDGAIEFHEEKASSLEGHLLVHVSFNYILFDAW
ncbi:MAG: hypothetical protein IPL52_02120 [Flavobacteriales bacterium]|nr:hypothetical protein [Flavobacteriales bacterium]